MIILPGGSMITFSTETADPIYCSAQTYRATRDNPAEYCETEVDQEGDLCDRHDEDDRADEMYDNYLESLRDQ